MNPTSQSFNIGGSTFGFSGIGVDDLEASEYTLAVIAVDMSGSVYGFTSEITAAVKAVIEACRNDPRADNLLIRIVTFNTSLQEFHGFKPLMNCNAADYDSAFQAGGGTALFDGAYTSIGSVDTYAQTLKKDDYQSNAIVFVITDGDDNSSSMSAASVALKAKEARGIGVAQDNVALESLMTVLIGVNIQEPRMKQVLATFKVEGEFDHYIELPDATAKTLARLAGFMSTSISSTSQALGTGGPSQQIAPAVSSLAI